MIERLRDGGVSLIYTTHYMEEAERLCDRVVIVDHGKVIADDTLGGLYRMLPASNLLDIELENGAGGLRLEDLRGLPEVRSAEFKGAALRVGVHHLAKETPRVLEWLVARGHVYRNVVSERANLETVFLTLTGRSLRD